MVYIRGDSVQLDAWEQLGNPGWNWATLNTYYKPLERFYPPFPYQVAAGAAYDASLHGTSGPLHVGFNPAITGGPFFDAAKAGWDTLGFDAVADFNDGTTRGFAAHQQTLDPNLNRRWDAASAFYWPVQTRKNLFLFSGPGSRIVWKAQQSGSTADRTASGIIIHPDGGADSYILTAKREVILCAGALRTPLILENSGIGNAAFLQSMGITPVIDLPGVGVGLNDQPNVGINYKSTLSETNYTAHVTFVTAKDIFGTDFDSIANSTRSQIPTWASQLAKGDSTAASAFERLFQLQHDLIFKSVCTVGEILTTISRGTVGVRYWELLPFSRGSVHITAKANFKNPVIDAGFFTIDFDMTMQTAIGRLARKLWVTTSAKQYAVQQTGPTIQTLPDNASDTQWDSFHRIYSGSISHPMGTAAMRSRDLLGVVDSQLKVYGTTNVRVVDASILPTQFSGHLTATCYAIAQRASEFVLAARKKRDLAERAETKFGAALRGRRVYEPER